MKNRVKTALCRMLPLRNTAAAATQRPGVLVVAVVGLLAAAPAMGADEPTAPAAERPGEAPLVDWSHAQEAYGLAERWVARADASQQPRRPIHVAGLAGVKITLRHQGATIGQGVVQLDPGSEQVQDLAELTRLASSRALVDLRDSLDQARRRARRSDDQDQAGIDPAKAIGPQVLVDLQVAHAATPIELAPQADARALWFSYAHGHHGLRMWPAGGGDLGPAWGWPADAIARNISPQDQVIQLLSAAGYNSTDLGRVARPDGPQLERFEVVHVVKPSRALPPMRLVRGQALVPTAGLNNQTLAAMANRMTGFLLRRQQESGAPSGLYAPTSQRYESEAAAPRDAALVAYALANRLAYLRRHDPLSADIERLDQTVRSLVEWIADQMAEAERSPAPTAALVALALAEGESFADLKGVRDAAVDRLDRLSLPDGGYRSHLDPAAERVAMTEQALIGAALSKVYLTTRRAELSVAADRALDYFWQHASDADKVAALPWLLQAELGLAKLGAPRWEQSQVSEAQRLEHLKTLLGALSERQVDQPPALGPRDVLGGYELAASPELLDAAAPHVDWRSALVLLGLAQALPEGTFTDAQAMVPRLLESAMAARFIAQLMFDEPTAYYTRNYEDVLGGVRMSVYDNRLAAAPTATALLAITRLQEALKRQQARGPVGE